MLLFFSAQRSTLSIYKIFARAWRAFHLVFTEYSEWREEEGKGKEDGEDKERKRLFKMALRAREWLQFRGEFYPKRNSVLTHSRVPRKLRYCISGCTNRLVLFDRAPRSIKVAASIESTLKNILWRLEWKCKASQRKFVLAPKIATRPFHSANLEQT